MADRFGSGSVCDMVLSLGHVSQRSCSRSASPTWRSSVSYHMVVYGIFFDVLPNGSFNNARCCHWDQYFRLTLLVVTHFLRVSDLISCAHIYNYEILIDIRSVLVSPSALPRFWLFMYRVTPVTYFVEVLISTSLSGAKVVCTAEEILTFEPPKGQDCGSYLKAYMIESGGSLLNPENMQQCQFCPVDSTNSLLAAIGIDVGDGWRNFSITLVYNLVNIAGTLFLYWLFRVPKGARRSNL